MVYQLHVDKEQQYNQLIKTLKDRVGFVVVFCLLFSFSSSTLLVRRQACETSLIRPLILQKTRTFLVVITCLRHSAALVEVTSLTIQDRGLVPFRT